MYLLNSTILHNRYMIEAVLGHGGFGITYSALDKVLNVKVAIKEYLPRQLATRAEGQTKVSIFTGEARQNYEYGLRKFLEEAQSVARFSHHPNIVSARDYFEANGTAYMVMEYVEGVTLKEYLEKKGGRIPFEEAKAIMMPVMDALREVHQAGLLHRDVSPDNVYITTGAQVKILDFGAARYFAGEQSKSLSVILKQGYAPEEQYRSSGKQGTWTDVYAVGATFYKALTGKTPPEALDRKEEDTLEPPSKLGVAIPPRAEQAVLKSLAINAAQRYQTMGEFQQALQGAEHSAGPFKTSMAATEATVALPGIRGGIGKTVCPKVSPARPASPAAPPSRKPRTISNPVAVAAGLVIAIFLGVGLYYQHLGRSGPPSSPIPVERTAMPENKVIKPDIPKTIPSPPAPPPAPVTMPQEPAVPPSPPQPVPDTLDRFQVGREWSLDWQSQFRYQGNMRIVQRLDANRYLTRITVSYLNNRNTTTTVSMDGLLTIQGNNVVINCSNASESWWDTDDFYLEWQNDTMRGYNLDKKGRRGTAVFQFVGDHAPHPTLSRPQLAVPSQPPGLVQNSLSRFQPGSRWSLNWQSMFNYKGIMVIQRQLSSNRFLGRITVNYWAQNRNITVSMDGLVTIQGNKVVINCSNASESWWYTDDFYLDWQNDTMTGYNVDKKGRRGTAVFRFQGAN